MALHTQIIWLFVLAIPVSCIAWTVTHEEIFRESREYCQKQSQVSKALLRRKFFYIFTCEYCFSFYVSILFIIITDYHLLFFDWRGYLIAVFSLVWIANIYMSLFFNIRLGIKKDGLEAKVKEKELDEITKE